MARETHVIELDPAAVAARAAAVAQETDEEILARLNERFQILEDMTLAVKRGSVRSMIVSGPPGTGKSHGVEQVLSRDDLFNTLAQRRPRYEIVKGATSSVGLYAKLFEYAAPGHVLVFDDCDTILMEEESLNTLKGALDSGERRYISWNKDSRLLRAQGVPDRFEFSGSVIFITNIKFDFVRSRRLRDHLMALESRSHYIDLQMDTTREKILRIRQIVAQGMLSRYLFEPDHEAQIIDFIVEHQAQLSELSLRMVLKIADLRREFPDTWRNMARTTCMSRQRP